MAEDIPEIHVRLTQLAEKIGSIYPNISLMIKNYLSLINEGIVDADTRKLEGKILHFLEEVLLVEDAESKYAYEEKNRAVLENLHKQINSIKALEHYVRLTEKGIDHPLIAMIEKIDHDIRELLGKELHMLK